MAYEFPAAKINLKGLDAEGINKKLTEYFSAIGDTAVEQLFGSIVSGYQQVGEGLMETAARLIVDKAVVMNILETTGKLIGEVVTETVTRLATAVTKIDLIAISESLIALAGSLDALQESAGKYYEAFYTDAEKQQDLQKNLTEIMTDLELTLPATREGYRALVAATDILTESGQNAYVTLLDAAEMADAYYAALEEGAQRVKDAYADYFSMFGTASEQQASVANELTTILSKLGYALPETRQGFIDLVAYVAGLGESGAAAYLSILEASGLANDYYSYIESANEDALAVAKEIADLYQNFFSAFSTEVEKQAKRAEELSTALLALGYAIPDTRAGFKDLVESVKLLGDSGKDSYLALLNASGTANEYYSYLERASESAAEAASKAATAYENYFASFSADVEKQARLMGELATALSSLGYTLPDTMIGYRLLVESIDQTTDSGKAAYLALIGLSDKVRQYYDYITAAEKERLTGLLETVNDEIDRLSKSVDSLKSARESMALVDEKFAYQKYMEARRQLQLAVEKAEAGQSFELGDDALGLLTEVNQGFFKTATDYQRAYWETYNAITKLENATQDQLTEAEIAAAAIQTEIDLLENQFDVLVQINDSVLAVQKAIETFQTAKSSVPAFQTGGEHRGGWRIVGESGPELEFTGASRIFSGSESKSLFNTTELVAEIKSLRADLNSGNYAIAKNTGKVSKFIERWDGDGLPDTRTTI
jgi:hypothetical protein